MMSTDKHIELNAEELRQKINLETGRLAWDELARHFARGVVLVISPKLDLVDVAVRFCADDIAQFETWTHNGLIHRAMDDDAHRWNDNKTVFWSVVVSPWVLVQEISDENPPA